MADPARRPRHSFAEYVRVEDQSTIKHEFFDGDIFAMAGGTPEHAAIAANVIASLHAQLVGTPCRVYSSDLRVRVSATGLTTYPDVTVVCGERETDPEDPNMVLNPTVILEVLSPSTAAYDRGEKLQHYQQTPSLREVVLVDHAGRQLEVSRVGSRFEQLEHQREGAFALASVSAELRLAEIYAGAS